MNIKYVFYSKNLKSENSIWLVIAVIFVLISAGYLFGNCFEWFDLSRDGAYDLLKETLSNYISVLGVGLAILAIIFAVIQLAYKRISIIQTVIEETYFIPLFYFGSFNILLCSLLMIFHTGIRLFPDYSFTRFVVIESYSFLLMIPLSILVFYKTLRITDLSNISTLYLSRTKKILFAEKNDNNRNYNERLQMAALEFNDEILYLIENNKIIELNKFFKFYREAISFNPNSKIFTGFKYKLKNWFIFSYNKIDKEALFCVTDNWWKLYEVILTLESYFKPLIADLPDLIYNDKVISGGGHSKELSVEIFPIRLKEFAQNTVYRKVLIDEKQVSDIARILDIFPELLKSIIEARDEHGLKETLQQLKQLKSVIQNNKDNILYHPDPMSAEDIKQIALKNSEHLERILFNIQFFNFSWLIYQLMQGSIRPDDKRLGVIRILKSYLNIDKKNFLSYITDANNEIPIIQHIEEWIRIDTMKLDGEMYILEHPDTIIALGTIVFWGLIQSYQDDLDENTIKNSKGLAHFVNEVINHYKTKMENWKILLNLPNDTEVNSYLDGIKLYFQDVDARNDFLIEKQLIQKQIPLDSIDEFKKFIVQQWKSSRLLSSIFEHYGAIHTNPEEDLKWVGYPNINLGRGRWLFTGFQNFKTAGVSFGFGVNDQIAALLFDHYLNMSSEKLTCKKRSILVGLDEIIKDHPAVNIVFLSNKTWISVRQELTQSGKFPDPNTSDELSFSYAGIYNSKLIIIPLSHRYIPLNMVYGLTLPGSIILKRKIRDEWIEGKLQIEIKEINRESAVDILKSKKPNSKIFSEEDIVSMMTGMLLEIDELLDFEIISAEDIVLIDISADDLTV